jgi:hypothetical protein
VADKIEAIGKADLKPKAEDIDVDKAWQDAKSWLTKIKVSSNEKPDVKKIREAMVKHKKPLTFVASWDGKWISVNAVVNGAIVDKEFSLDVSWGGDQKKWRETLVLMSKSTKLVTDADIKAFDDKHPDPDEVIKLKAEINSLMNAIKIDKMQIDRLNKDMMPKLEELKRKQDLVKKLGG